MPAGRRRTTVRRGLRSIYGGLGRSERGLLTALAEGAELLQLSRQVRLLLALGLRLTLLVIPVTVGASLRIPGVPALHRDASLPVPITDPCPGRVRLGIMALPVADLRPAQLLQSAIVHPTPERVDGPGHLLKVLDQLPLQLFFRGHQAATSSA